MNSLAGVRDKSGAMAYRRDPDPDASRAQDRRRSAKIGLFSMMLLAACLFVVWSQVQVVQASYSLSRLRGREQGLISHNERLTLEISTLRAPANLSREAAKKLEMVPPVPGQLVMVK